ncbi:hypothetical protein Fot_35421 [Forsythia ovata]|uniref:Uncharacterized protein n=1 Tax=Forsythia ovata TaxID=205694 RepID=A0ABD1SLH0_9LAMI
MDTKDDDELRSENRVLHSKLSLVHEARVQAEYKLMKSETIQKVYIDARKWVEFKQKVCEYIAYAKHKELAEALEELSKAKESLAKLGVFSCADPKVLAGLLPNLSQSQYLFGTFCSHSSFRSPPFFA